MAWDFLQMLPERVRSCGHGTPPAVCAALKSAAFSYPYTRGSGKTMIEITLFRAKTRKPVGRRGYRIGSCTIAYHALTLTGELFRDRPGSCESGISTSRQGGKACRPTVVTVARQLIVPQQPLPGVLLLAF